MSNQTNQVPISADMRPQNLNKQSSPQNQIQTSLANSQVSTIAYHKQMLQNNQIQSHIPQQTLIKGTQLQDGQNNNREQMNQRSQQASVNTNQQQSMANLNFKNNQNLQNFPFQAKQSVPQIYHRDDQARDQKNVLQNQNEFIKTNTSNYANTQNINEQNKLKTVPNFFQFDYGTPSKEYLEEWKEEQKQKQKKLEDLKHFQKKIQKNTNLFKSFNEQDEQKENQNISSLNKSSKNLTDGDLSLSEAEEIQQQLKKYRNQNLELQKQIMQYQKANLQNIGLMEQILADLNDIVNYFGYDFKPQITQLKQIKNHEDIKDHIETIIQMLTNLKNDNKLQKISDFNINEFQSKLSTSEKEKFEFSVSTLHLPKSTYLQTIQDLQEQNIQLQNQVKLLETKQQYLATRQEYQSLDKSTISQFGQSKESKSLNYTLYENANQKSINKVPQPQERRYVYYT